jgi:hypothetical protein
MDWSLALNVSGAALGVIGLIATAVQTAMALR